MTVYVIYKIIYLICYNYSLEDLVTIVQISHVFLTMFTKDVYLMELLSSTGLLYLIALMLTLV